MASKPTPALLKKPPAKKAGTAVVAWEDKMRASAQKQAKAEKPTNLGSSISIRGGHMMIDGETVEGDELNVIVIAAVHENQYYDRDYDPQNPTVPVCYAFSDPDDDDPDTIDERMANEPEGDAPQGQEDPNEDGIPGGKCENCWANKFGSADKGRGKACKNIRRLAVITEDSIESAEALTAAEVRTLKVPVMSVANWGKFVRTCAEDVDRPSYGVVCTIGVIPDAKSQFKLTFTFTNLVNFDQDLWTAMEKKVAEVNKQIVSKYPKQADLDAQEKPVQARGKLSQKMAAKKGGKAAPARRGKF